MRSSNTNSTKLPRWSEIPPELLQLLLEKLPSYFVHTLRFKAVCPSWNHAAKSYVSGPSYTPLPQSPWLMLPAQRRKKRLPSDPDVEEEEGCFFSLAEEKVYRIKRNVFRGLRDDFYWSRCVGSSHGWLAIWNPKAGEIFKEIIYLANPICGESRTLPPLHVPHISKVVLSCDPSRNQNFVVVVASHGGGGGRLAFYKHGGGNTAWTKLDLVREQKYCEIVFHNCHLFALCSDHSVHVWDFGETYNHPKKTMELQPLMEQMVYGDGDGIRHRLVESMGEILLVEHGPSLYPSWDEISVPFYVYKLNFDAKRWEKVDSLGDRAIFLVENLSAMSLSTHKLPELEENSIYFTAEVSDPVSDGRPCDFFEFHLGVYNLETKVVKSLYKSGLAGNRNNHSEPVWIVPNPQLNFVDEKWENVERLGGRASCMAKIEPQCCNHFGNFQKSSSSIYLKNSFTTHLVCSQPMVIAAQLACSVQVQYFPHLIPENVCKRALSGLIAFVFLCYVTFII